MFALIALTLTAAVLGGPAARAAQELPRPTSCAGCYKPRATTSPWQIQFQGRIDTSVRARFFDIDGYEATRTVRALQRGDRKVACYINAGAWEDFRTDKNGFPPEVLGNEYEGFREERWLDIRRIDLLAPILSARIDRAERRASTAWIPTTSTASKTTPASRSRRPINSGSTRGWRTRRTPAG